MRFDSKTSSIFFLVTALAGALPLEPMAAPPGAREGREVVAQVCSACHQVGVMGAPKLGNREDWAPRTAQGRALLVEHARQGFGQMPPRGGDASLSDLEIDRAVGHMLAMLETPVADGSGVDARDAATSESAAGAGPQQQSGEKPAGNADSSGSAPQRIARVNQFNRLMKPPSMWNPPPTEDGIHDPENVGTQMLQPPRDAFAALPKSTSGNRVDWVQALQSGKVTPRYDRVDTEKQPVVFDFDVVREVKGSMPDVVYPHKQHTEWLDCVNCHPGIFVPKKGANQISMASIMMGEKCGVCHGKVAFPISECRRCHSKDKPQQNEAK